MKEIKTSGGFEKLRKTATRSMKSSRLTLFMDTIASLLMSYIAVWLLVKNSQTLLEAAGGKGFLFYTLGTVSTVIMLYVAAITTFYSLIPLFRKYDEAPRLGTEITERAAPEIFRIVRELSVKTGVKIPQHIIITNGDAISLEVKVNSLYSLLSGKDTILKIGYAFFNTLNSEEMRALIAHEFAMFAGKEGKTYRLTMKMLKYSQLRCLNSNRAIDILQAHMTKGNIIMRMLGATAMLFVGYMETCIQKSLQLANKSASSIIRTRCLEADLMVAGIVGADVMRSAIHKEKATRNMMLQYRKMTLAFNQSGCCVNNHLMACDIAMDALLENSRIPSDTRKLATMMQDEYYDKYSQFALYDFSIILPQEEARIENLADCVAKSQINGFETAWSMLTQHFRNRYGYETCFAINTYPTLCHTVSIIKWKEFVEQYTEIDSMPEDYKPFFMHRFVLSDATSDYDAALLPESPFNDTNRELLEKNIATCNDIQTISTLQPYSYIILDFFYGDDIYDNIDDVANAAQKRYDKMKNDVIGIDKSMIAYLCKNSSKESDTIMQLYNNMTYATDFAAMAMEIKSKVNDVIEQCKAGRLTRQLLDSKFSDTLWSMHKLLGSMDYTLFSSFSNSRTAELIDSMKRTKITNNISDVELMCNRMLQVADSLHIEHNLYTETLRRRLWTIAKPLLMPKAS